jgi:hypothetical protein
MSQGGGLDRQLQLGTELMVERAAAGRPCFYSPSRGQSSCIPHGEAPQADCRASVRRCRFPERSQSLVHHWFWRKFGAWKRRFGARHAGHDEAVFIRSVHASRARVISLRVAFLSPARRLLTRKLSGCTPLAGRHPSGSRSRETCHAAPPAGPSKPHAATTKLL